MHDKDRGVWKESLNQSFHEVAPGGPSALRAAHAGSLALTSQHLNQPSYDHSVP
jgi:hypothetical protein